MIRGWHPNGDVCYQQACGLPHRPPLGERTSLDHAVRRADVLAPLDSGPAHDPDGTIRIGRRTPEESSAYIAAKRAELVAAGHLVEARALDDVESIIRGETLDEWVGRRAAEIAQAFHEAYERLAPEHGYRTREASAKPWAEVPDDNKALMIATASDLLRRGEIR